METARGFVTAMALTEADRNRQLACPSIPSGTMAAAVTVAFATWSLFFAPAVLAQPTPDSLGEPLVDKAAFGDWRTDAPLVRR